jgi:DNA-binding FrmR family transcriptional regulator
MDMQAIHNQQPIIRKLQSATAYLETIQELYQSNEDPLELAGQLQAAIGVLREIRREVLLQELTTALHNEDLQETVRNEKVVRIFQLLT